MPVANHRPRVWPVGPKLNKPTDVDMRRRPSASLDQVRWNRQITEAVRRGDLQTALQFKEEMVTKGSRPNQLTYTVLIDGLARLQHFDKANRLLEEMKERRVLPNSITYNALVNGYCRAERLADAEQLISWMEGLGGDVTPNAVTYSTLINMYAKRGDIGAVQKTLKRMIERGLSPTTVTFNSVISACAKVGDIKEAERWLAEMLKQGCEPTSYTFVPLLSLHANAKDFTRVSALLAQMREHNVAPTAEVYVTLARSYVRSGNNEKLEELLRDLRERGLPPSLFVHNAIIEALASEGRVAQAEQQVESLLGDNLKPDRFTYFPLFTAYSARGQVADAARIFALMESTPGCEPDEGAYLRLASAWVRACNTTQARALLDRLHQLGKSTRFAESVYNSVLQALAMKAEMAEAEQVLADMRARSCTPSAPALMALAAAWDGAGNAAKTKEALQLFKARGGADVDKAQLASLRAQWAARGTAK